MTTCKERRNIVSLIIVFYMMTVLGCVNSDDGKSNTDRGDSYRPGANLIRRLIYSDEKTKSEARKELETVSDQAKALLVPELLAALKYRRINEPNEIVYRYRAAETLGLLGPVAKGTGPDLVEAMRNDESDLVRKYAALSLAKIDVPETAVPALIAALTDGQISSGVTDALAKIGRPSVPALIAALGHRDGRVRSGAARALAQMGPKANDAAPALLNAFREETDERLKHHFAEALRRLGPAVTEDTATLLQDLRNKDAAARYNAVNALAAKGASAAPAVLKLLADSEKDLRFWAAYLLAGYKPAPDGAAAALEAALKDDDQGVRGNAVWALRETGLARVTVKDVSDDELAAVDRVLALKPTDGDILVHTVDRLNGLRIAYPTSLKTDQLLFRSALAKVALGGLIGEGGRRSPLLESYCEKHKDDYLGFLGVMYKGNDFKALIEGFPRSPLAGDAAYLMALEQTKVGECEGDMSCELRASIGIFLPYLKDYPSHPKVVSVIEGIDETLSNLFRDPSQGGGELFELGASANLLREYHKVIKSLPDADLRERALYSLARAYISAGEFEAADNLYEELDQKVRIRAALQFFDRAEKDSDSQSLSAAELARLTAPLSDPSEKTRLEALQNIAHTDVMNRPFAFAILLKLGRAAEKDESPAIRKHAIEVIGEMASDTSFFRAAVGYCISHDSDKQNQYYCARLGIDHPNLKSTEFYAFNRERIDSIMTEATGQPYPTPEMLAEWRETALRRDREAANLIMERSGARKVTIFGNEYVIVRKKFRPERDIPLYLVMMFLCGFYCYKIAERRGADKRFWFILAALTAPISLFYILFIPKRARK